MELYLVDYWLYLTVTNQILYGLAREVAYSQMFGISLEYTLFHILPNVAYLTMSPLVLVVEPTCWELQTVKVHIL